MAEPEVTPNGSDPVLAELPEGSYRIVITVTPDARGPKMHVESTPAQLFPDTIIDACERAARFHNRIAAANQTLAAFAQAQKNAEVAGQVRGLMGPDGRRVL